LRRGLFEAARDAWPGVELPFAEFVRYLDQLGQADPAPREASDLYLCAACAAGAPNALLSLERAFFPLMRASITRVIGRDGDVEDVLQEIRRRLFVEPHARIKGYRGDGSLSSWLRVVGIHAALDHRRAQSARRNRDRRQRLLEVDAPVERPLLDDIMFEHHLALKCKRELAVAVGGLRSEERELLLRYFVMGSSIDVLGAQYAVNRATIARRIHRHIERIRDHLQLHLAHELGTTSARELSTLFRSLTDLGDFSATTLLRPPAD
jgi:RNA polymerase sigma-70 factor